MFTKTWYEADKDLSGSGFCLCGHKHKTVEAAKRCLPKAPKSHGNVVYINMAQIRKYNMKTDVYEIVREE